MLCIVFLTLSGIVIELPPLSLMLLCIGFFFFSPPMLLFLSLLYVFKGIILFLLREKDGAKTKGRKKTI